MISGPRGRKPKARSEGVPVVKKCMAVTEKGTGAAVMKIFEDLQQGSDVRGIAMEGQRFELHTQEAECIDRDSG